MKHYQPIFEKQTDSLMLPRLVRVAGNLVSASFQLMKLLPAKYVVEKAWHEGRINPKLGVIESSSGTYALGLGLVCAELAIPFHVISDAAIDTRLQNRLVDLGGTVAIVNASAHSGNLQVVRMEALREHRERFPGTFWPQQYDNPENQDAYAAFAEQLLDKVGNDLILVATVGSGSSTSGTIKPLRKANPSIKLVGVDTFGSVLFGLPNGKRMLRGLGNGLHPQNVVHHYFDEVHWVSASQAFAQTRELHRRSGLFMGPTTGAAFMVAEFLASQNPSSQVVFIAPDEGYRYQDTIYNNEWLREMDLFQPQLITEPSAVTSLAEVQGEWACFPWNRRSFEEVTGRSY